MEDVAEGEDVDKPALQESPQCRNAALQLPMDLTSVIGLRGTVKTFLTLGIVQVASLLGLLAIGWYS